MKIINLQLSNTGTYNLFAKKYCRGFEQNGYEYCELNNLNNFLSEEDDILFVNNNDVSYLPELYAKYNHSNFILWFFHDYIEKIHFKKWILTGEEFKEYPKLESHKKFYNIQKNLKNYIPIKFSSCLDENEIDNCKNMFNRELDGCFIGTGYKQEWLNYISKNYKIFLNTKAMSISENERVYRYLTSKICFGFNSADNINNSVISERAYEGMAFGCLTFCDVPCCEKVTDGCLIYVSSLQDLIEKMNYYLNNQDKMKEHVNKSLEWSKNNGIYKHTVKPFINYFNTLKG